MSRSAKPNYQTPEPVGRIEALPLLPDTAVVADSAEVSAAYSYCQQVTRQHAKSFYFSARFLPAHKRKPIYAVYALCRHVDDAVDEAGVHSERQARIAVEEWERRLNAVYRGEAIGDGNPVLIAWRDMLRRYAIRKELPLELMRGVLMDTYRNRYDTWDGLRLYCYRVASVVGLISSEIFGYDEPRTLAYAEALGVAMQLTNILRDVGEDARMNRIYLPREDLERFGYTADELLRGEINDCFVALMRFEIDRAREFYAEAELGIPLLEPDARFTVLLAARLYAAILEKIEAANYDVFTRRAHLSLPAKIASLPRIWRAARTL